MISLGWVDPLRLIVWTFRNALPALSDDAALPGRKELVLVREGWRHPQLDKWGTAKSFITRVRRLAEKGDWRMIRAEIEVLAPHTALPWVTGIKDEAEVHVCLFGNPGSVIIEGQAINPFPGAVWGMGDIAALRSAANNGDTERAHLILTLRKETEE